MCFYNRSSFLVPPTEAARALALYFKASIILTAIISISEFLAVALIPSALFDLFTALIGYAAIRSSEGYVYQQVSCYLMLHVVMAALALINAAFWINAVVTDATTSLAAWQYAFYVFAVVAAPLVHVVACVIAYRMYRALRAVIEEITDELNADDDDTEGSYVAPGYERSPGLPSMPMTSITTQPPPVVTSTPTAVLATNPSFKPFSGTGHRLS